MAKKPKPKPKTYKTLAELRHAYAFGEIKNADGTVPPLMLDNDNTTVYVDLTYDGDGDVDDSKKVFDMHPANLLPAALKLLGIPYEDA